jgi:hypothetical protein
MRKSLLLILGLLVVASLLLGACAGAPAEEPAAPAEEPAEPAEEPAEPAEEPEPGKTVLNVWSFTNEIRTMGIAFEGKRPDDGW